MNRNRAPRGIPTGGQFIATPHSESEVTLKKAINGARRDYREQQWLTLQNSEPAAPVERRALTFDGVTDSIADSRLAGALEAAVDDLQERHQAPIDAATGSFVTWGQMVPKFLRRK
jgi:hypothetical protein